ncbi:hypothetical protein COY07_01245 [Candidatus Peregrinibacteria bacterium CG_4_10_14_0_2_um_filter_43_11]|nr:MAG: hypothetical protein COY07_01245 [Candidatus Peregrinibacteria bacterium CG_4_10_14_0_2_um_filter_43_11]
MKYRIALIPVLLLALLVVPKNALAEVNPGSLLLKTDFRIWQVDLKNVDLTSTYTKARFKGIDINIPEDQLSYVTPYIDYETVEGLDIIKLQTYLENKIAPDIYREREDVTINMDEKDKVAFEGSGLYGRKLDTKKAAFMLKKAIEEKGNYLHLPLINDPPQITLKGEGLKEKGIIELVSAGETEFKGSPENRINNIKVGLSKFNGHFISPGEEFSFGNVLGVVDETTGYKKELVIKGDRTVPEYGGGLCQVSTTAYRAVLASGFPVTQRRNHSYAVSYYAPTGLDATVYPPTVDMKFVNDSPAYILMQSFTVGTKAYYNFYGTKDKRKVHLIGPYYYNQKSPPPTRTEYTTKLAPGEKQVLGHAVPGISSSWYRQVVYEDPKKEPYFESIHSNYQARPDFIAIGAEKEVSSENSMIEDGY